MFSESSHVYSQGIQDMQSEVQLDQKYKDYNASLMQESITSALHIFLESQSVFKTSATKNSH